MTKWIIPCNTKYYNVKGAFTKLKVLDWKQSNKNIAIGDIVYIYISAPTSAIKYKCKVNKVLLSQIEIDDHEYILNGENYVGYGCHMELELLMEYDQEYSLAELKAHGLSGNIQGPRKIKDELDRFIV